MCSFTRLTLLTSSFLLAFSGTVNAAKPAAQYWMSISTENMTVPGMEAASGGGLEGMLGSMAMKGMGVGGGPNRTLFLDLLGPDTPASPSAEHLIPPGLKMGSSLPLVTPTPHGSTGTEEGGKREDIRILLYWGCGDNVRTGQPRVLDTAKMSAEDYSSVLVSRGGGSRFRLAPRPIKSIARRCQPTSFNGFTSGAGLVSSHTPAPNNPTTTYCAGVRPA